MQNLIKYPFVKWVCVMFPYGFYRQYTFNYDKPYDLFTYKLVFSSINGYIYTSPIGVTKIFDFINRCEIAISKKEKEQYKSSYSELFGHNYNTF